MLCVETLLAVGGCRILGIGLASTQGRKDCTPATGWKTLMGGTGACIGTEGVHTLGRSPK